MRECRREQLPAHLPSRLVLQHGWRCGLPRVARTVLDLRAASSPPHNPFNPERSAVHV